MKNWLIISLLLLFAGCFQEETPIEPVKPFHETLTASADSNNLVFYSLATREPVRKSNMNKWDLAFENQPNGFNVLINSARGMRVYNTRVADFRISVSPVDLPWEKDKPCSDLQLTCIGQWGDLQSVNPVSDRYLYVLDMGFDRFGNALGYMKFYIAGFTDGYYLVRFSDLNGGNEHLKLISKNEKYNFTYISLLNGGQEVMVEPPKDQWDIVLSPYIDTIQGILGPEDIGLNTKYALYYGILTNPASVKVSVDTTGEWDDIQYFDSKQYPYSRNTATVGNSWYSWNSTNAAYDVESTLFCLRDSRWNIYLVRFNAFSRDGGNTVISFQYKNL